MTYQEDSEVYTAGGRITCDLPWSTVLGAEFNTFSEKREGDYRAAFFPTGISPAPGQHIAAFDTPVHSSDDNQRRDIGVDLRSTLNSGLMLNFRVYNSYYEKRNSTTAVNWQDAGYSSEDVSASLGMNADVDLWTYEAFAVWAPGIRHLMTIGGEYRDEAREGTVFNAAGTPETRSVEYKAGYLQDEWRITDKLSAILGARYDHIRQSELTESDDRITVKAGLVNRFSDMLILRGNFAQGYRTPDIRELYIRKNTPAGAQRGAAVNDPGLGKTPHDLDPEFVNNYEIGVSGSFRQMHYSAAVFYNDISDKIEEVTKNPGQANSYTTFENISDAITYGLELSAGYDFDAGICFDVSWFELRTENEQSGADLEFNPERQITATLRYAGDRFETWVMGKYIGEQYTPATPDHWVDAYILVDAGARYFLDKRRRYALYGGVDNLFDERVDKLIGSSVGPYLYAGLRADF